MTCASAQFLKPLLTARGLNIAGSNFSLDNMSDPEQPRFRLKTAIRRRKAFLEADFAEATKKASNIASSAD